jgi:hypothetical protein
VAFGRPPRTATLVVVVSAVGLLAYVSALLTVDRQRHSAGHGAGLRFLIDTVTNAIPARSRPFRNGAHAQFWYELRRNGVLLPAAVLLVMFFIPLPALFVGRLSAGATIVSFIWMCGGPLALAAVVGKVFVRPDAWSFDLALPTFVSTRPILPGDYLGAKLKAAAVSTLIAWTIVLVLGPLSLHFCNDTTKLWKAWKFLREVFPQPILALLSIGAVLSLMLLTWKLLIKSAWMALRGPGWLYVTAVFAELIVTVTIAIVVVDRLDSDKSSAPGGWWFRAIPTIAAILVAATAIKLASAIIALRRSLAAGHMVTRQIGWTFFFWLAGTLCIATTAYVFAWRYPVLFYITTAPWLKGIAGLLGLLSLPLARLAFAPSQFAGNRHR